MRKNKYLRGNDKLLKRMGMERNLPIGLQSFADIIRDGYVYIDKTQHIYNLAKMGRYYFLSRPRRFGKSLLLSTIHEYFAGNKELFSGLYLGEHETEWKKHPVFHFDFSLQKYGTNDALNAMLDEILNKYEKEYGVANISSSLSLRFKSLLETASEKTGLGCVVLVDEYDKPMLESYDNPVLNEHYRKTFKSFFGVLKGSNQYVRFAFFTGIIKLHNVSIFSDLNNLRDISLSEKYSDICGITQEELENNLEPEIIDMTQRGGFTQEECLRRLKKMYDGYHFAINMVDIYNPFSLLNALDMGNPTSYWFAQATPAFLIERLKKGIYTVVDYNEGCDVDESLLGDIDISPNDPTSLFYQSGYLTIKSYDTLFRSFKVAFPNEEIRSGFVKWLVPHYFNNLPVGIMVWHAQQITCTLMVCELEKLFTVLKSVFSFLPYDEGSGDKEKMYEQSIRNAATVVFVMVGSYVVCEQHFSHGRSDLVVQTSDYIYLFEFKINQSAQVALDQIEEKKYADSFMSGAKKIVKLGVNFSSEERNISEWKVAE